MPNIFSTLGYHIYFWSNENDEPIHVHVSKGRPNAHATKFGLLNLEDVCWLVTDVITAQYDLICERWMKYFNAKQIQFYI